MDSDLKSIIDLVNRAADAGKFGWDIAERLGRHYEQTGGSNEGVTEQGLEDAVFRLQQFASFNRTPQPR